MFCLEGYLCNAVHLIIFAACSEKKPKIRENSCIWQTSRILFDTVMSMASCGFVFVRVALPLRSEALLVNR